MEQILNFRLLAEGVTNRQGKQIKNIYRSADVSSASDNDIEQLLELGINNIIDLRSAEEKSTPLTNENITITDFDIIGNGKQNELDKYDASSIAKIMIDLYEHAFVMTDGFAEELKFIESLEAKPFLFHCTAGKDRTGITGAILMHLLDFSYEDIKNEYLKIDEVLVNVMMNKIMKQFAGNDIEVDVESLRAIASVSESFLEAYILGITDEYGTVDKYFEDKLQVTPELTAKLRAAYLD